jgi:hypothetical protein
MVLIDYIGIFFLHFPILLTDDCNIKFYAFYTKLSPIKKSAGIIPSINNLISINLTMG